MSLKYKWNHVPPLDHSISPEFLSIPLLSAVSCCAQINRHKYQPTQDSPVEEAIYGGCDPGKGEIDEALESVVRADDILEGTFCGEGVLPQAGQVSVALVLFPTSKHVQRQTHQRLARDESVREVVIPGYKNGT